MKRSVCVAVLVMSVVQNFVKHIIQLNDNPINHSRLA